VEASPLDIIARDMPRLWAAVAACPVPVIAAVRGYAIGGGCELAMHADIIVAGRSARFAQPEVQIGITPGGGATQRLTRAVGKFAAMRMVLTGEAIDADEAKAIGLVSLVVDDAEVLDRALAMARRIAGFPFFAVRQTKCLVLDSMNVPLDAGLRLEARAFQLCFATPEKSQRMRAFLDRRRGADKGAG
jgi:enoyl-CoA hydratase/carnithine racemase